MGGEHSSFDPTCVTRPVPERGAAPVERGERQRVFQPPLSSSRPCHLAERGERRVPRMQMLYPMFAAPLGKVLEMKTHEAHQSLKRTGTVVQVNGSIDPVIFVSHQWCGKMHPDPTFEQFAVLQQALRNVIAGRVQIETNWLSHVRGMIFEARSVLEGSSQMDIEWLQNLGEGWLPEKLSSTDVEHLGNCHIWYDYFSMPQPEEAPGDQDMFMELAAAIYSIPAYIELAKHFLILAPTIRHTDRPSMMLDYPSWRSRSWCRMERVARALMAERNQILLVEGGTQVSLLGVHEYLFTPPGHGELSVESDRECIAPIMSAVLERSLAASLESQQFHRYRVLLSMRGRLAEGLPLEAGSIGVVPACLETDATDEFLRQNGLLGPLQHDLHGWAPVHYAGVAGDEEVLRNLFDRNADVNCQTTKPDPDCLLEAGVSILMLASYLNGSGCIVDFLLRQRADVNTATGVGGNTALHFACMSGHISALEALIHGRADVNYRDAFDNTSITAAVANRNEDMVSVLLEATASIDKNLHGVSPLHYAAWAARPSASLMTQLVNAECDVNSQVRLPPRSVYGPVCFSASFAFRKNERTEFAALFHHWPGSTPLMIAAFFGNSDAAAVLIDSLADPSVRNFRGATAAALAALRKKPTDFLPRCSGEAGTAGSEEDCELASEEMRRIGVMGSADTFPTATKGLLVALFGSETSPKPARERKRISL